MTLLLWKVVVFSVAVIIINEHRHFGMNIQFKRAMWTYAFCIGTVLFLPDVQFDNAAIVSLMLMGISIVAASQIETGDWTRDQRIGMVLIPVLWADAIAAALLRQ